MSSRFLIITAAVALPVVALALPYLRRPTPKPTRPPPELPAGVERRSTPEGLEILVARPLFDLSATRSNGLAPILLLHGEFGTAMEWHRWLSYLASKGRTVYALSLSGHGESPRPGNFVYMGLKDLSRDLQAALDYIFLEDTSAPDPVLVAHSWGGGLAQYTIANSNPDDGDNLVSGLVLLASIPPSGMHRALVAWMRHDPWYIPRAIWDMGDIRSLLSTPPLVRRAFFGTHTPRTVVQEFFNFYMNHEETVSWMRDMMFRYVKPRDVTAKVPGGRVFCMGGDRDALITPDIVRDTAGEYGVGMVYVRPSGHHMQNDVSWKEAADVVLDKVAQWGL